MKISNVTLNGEGIKKYFWMYLFEILLFLGIEIVFTGTTTISNFHWKLGDTKYALCRFSIENIKDEEIAAGDYLIREVRNELRNNRFRSKT